MTGGVPRALPLDPFSGAPLRVKSRGEIDGGGTLRNVVACPSRRPRSDVDRPMARYSRDRRFRPTRIGRINAAKLLRLPSLRDAHHVANERLFGSPRLLCMRGDDPLQ